MNGAAVATVPWVSHEWDLHCSIFRSLNEPYWRRCRRHATEIVLAHADTAQAVIHKVPTTREDPSIGVSLGVVGLCAIADIDLSQIDQVLHGITIATNAVLSITAP